MNGGNKTIDSVDLLREARDLKVAEIIIPAVILTVVVAVIGIIPNGVTVIFYGYKTKKKSSTTMLITALAASDLMVSMSVFGFLIDFTDIFYAEVITCKLAYFGIHWVVSLSVTILWLVSIDRYLKMCTKTRWQFNTTYIKFALLGLFIITLVNSVRNIWLYDAIEYNITVVSRNASVIGHICTNTDEPDLQTVIVGFHIIDIISCVIFLCTFVFTYGRIWWTVRQHNIERSCENTDASKRLYQSTYNVEKTLSKMMCFVSVGFVVCFVPYFVAMIMHMSSNKRDFNLQPWYRVIIRTPVLNNILNPIIYCTSDQRYRKYVKSLVFCSCLKKNSDDHSISES